MQRVRPELKQNAFFKAIQSSFTKGAPATNPFGTSVKLAEDIAKITEDDSIVQRMKELQGRAQIVFDQDPQEPSLETAPAPFPKRTAVTQLSKEGVKALDAMEEFFTNQDETLSTHFSSRWSDFILMDKDQFEKAEQSRIFANRAALSKGVDKLKASGIPQKLLFDIDHHYQSYYDKIETELENDAIPGAEAIPNLLENGAKLYGYLEEEAGNADKRMETLKGDLKTMTEEKENLDIATVQTEAQKNPQWYWEAEDDIVNHRWDPEADFEAEDPETWQHNWKHVEFPFGIGPTITIPGMDSLKKMLKRE